MNKARESLLMYRILRKREWTMQNAVKQVELWKAGVRDHRIADDTMSAYETIRYGEATR